MSFHNLLQTLKKQTHILCLNKMCLLPRHYWSKGSVRFAQVIQILKIYLNTLAGNKADSNNYLLATRYIANDYKMSAYVSLYLIKYKLIRVTRINKYKM